MALYNCRGLVAPRLNFEQGPVSFACVCFAFWIDTSVLKF